MNARLSMDILENRQRSRFMRTDVGRFALREWKEKVPEYVAPRRKINLLDEDVLVFDRHILREFVPRDGITSADINHQKLFGNCFPMRRSRAEEDFSVIQLVSAYIVRYSNTYLTYKRTKRLPESRLHGAYSVFFGGHLNPDDTLPLLSFADPELVLVYMLRELNEELRIPQPYPNIEFRGLLYDPRSEVSKQHIGVVFNVTLKHPNFEVGERGFLIDAKFESKALMLARIHDFENWSQLLLRELIT